MLSMINLKYICLRYFEIVEGVFKKIDLLYLFNISGIKKWISKLFDSSENWYPFVNSEYRTISVRY